MTGTDRPTGKPIDRPAHITQSIEVLLTTPKGTRVMRRDVGMASLNTDGTSKDELTQSDVESDIRQTLAEFEPRIRVLDIDIKLASGKLSSIVVNYEDVENASRSSTKVTYATT